MVKQSLQDDSLKKISATDYVEQKKMWETELEKVRAQLHASQRVNIF